MTKSTAVSARMAGFEDAPIDAATQMLDEGAEQAAIGVSNGKLPVEKDIDVAHAE